MSKLQLAFLQRQSQQEFPRSRLSSTSTISSAEAEENIRQHEESERQQEETIYNNGNSETSSPFTIGSVNEMCVNNHVMKNVYQNYHSCSEKVKCFEFLSNQKRE